MADRAAQQRVLAQVDPADLVGLASALIRIPSFKTEETPVARFLAPFFRERDYRVELQEVEPGRLYVGGPTSTRVRPIPWRTDKGRLCLPRSVNGGAERSADSGTENIPPARVRVKWRGKSPPARE